MSTRTRERWAYASVRARIFGRGGRAPRVGRYALLEELGQGGMGVVHRAHDPELGRDVAIKLFTRRLSGDDGRRNVDEARALAMLDHPNVVRVFDVGVEEDRIFVAMELVEGTTLRGWLEAGPRSRNEIVAVLLAAGRGLAAAHGAGIIHRDIKPSNVLVGVDGRVRVVDFGIAAEYEPSTQSPRSHHTTRERGFVEGTPPYMAPEQHGGAGPDPAADQYAYCVMAVELLSGRHPFLGWSRHDLLAVKSNAPSRWPPAGISWRMWSALRRGLSPEPADRFPSMSALLQALDRVERRRTMATVAGGVIVLGLAVAWLWDRPSEPASPCEQSRPAPLTFEDRVQARDAFAASGLRAASDAWTRVDARLQAFEQQWIDAYARACEADRVDVATLSCLGHARQRARTFVALLRPATSEDLRTAVTNVWGATQLASCVASTGPETADDPRTRRLAEADALRDLGHLDDAGRLLDDLLEELADDRSALAVRTLTSRGLLRLDDGRLEEARADLDAAYLLAVGLGFDELAFWPALHMASLEAHRSDDEAALPWLRRAEAAADRARLDTVHADLLGAHAAIALAAGRSDEAASTYALEIELLRSGDDLPRLAAALHEAATALAAAGRPDEAAERLREALRAWEQIGGEATLDAATTRGNLAIVLAEAGRYEDAIVEHTRSIELYERIGDGPLRDLGNAYGNLGVALTYAGRHEEAIASLRDGLARLQSALGPDDVDVARTRVNLGLALYNTGRVEDAHAEYIAAHEWFRGALGDAHPLTAVAKANVADALASLGRDDEAAHLGAEAAVALEAALGADHPHLAATLANLGDAELRLGRRSEGLAAFDRALQIHERAPTDPIVAAAVARRIAAALGEEAGPNDLSTRAQRLLDR